MTYGVPSDTVPNDRYPYYADLCPTCSLHNRHRPGGRFCIELHVRSVRRTWPEGVLRRSRSVPRPR